ncbi:MAG: hypothetical protein EA364_03025 [Balneolaceae bacterium]|nr:MAG: hypothetical protein EA364_03025 [Balneolaceae bacterium]
MKIQSHSSHPSNLSNSSQLPRLTRLTHLSKLTHPYSRIISTFAVAILYMAAILMMSACSRTEPSGGAAQVPAEFIASHTAGMAGSHDAIRVTLTSDASSKPETGRLFTLEPSVRGDVTWENDRTVIFRPSSPLESGREYRVLFSLGDVAEVPDEYRVVQFGFTTIRQDMDIRVDAVSLTDEGEFVIRGAVLTADVAVPANVKRVLRAEVDGRELPVLWPAGGDRRNHPFEVAGIGRTSADAMLRMRWDGSSIGATSTGVRETEIPATGRFTLMTTRVIHDQNPHIELTFSGIPDARQNLRGLVRIGESDDLNILVQGNRMRVFYTPGEEEMYTLHLDRGIRNREGQTLDRAYEERLRLKRVMPAVNLAGRGVILPASERMLIPFEATGLGAVDVRVERIFEDNIPQFLQVNDLGGDRELNRVGVMVFGKTVPLATLGTFDPDKRTTFALDLSRLMEPEPGAIYRVNIGFRAHHRAIACPGETLPGSFADLDPSHWLLNAAEEADWWERTSGYWWPSDYNWMERDNPCSNSYYTRDKWVGRNLLASDLGIIAKGADGGPLEVFVTDLNTTRARAGVDLQFYSAQRRLIGEARTGSNGHARIELPETAALLIATAGESRGYLRLLGGQALSLSAFDVSGSRVQEGLKGFLYGERGVWRPGDSLFVSLIVEDGAGRLPQNHPVVFELRNPEGQVMEKRTVTGGLNGFYSFRTKTDAAAPTGFWSVNAQVGGARFNRSLRVETIRPNRLDINLDLEQDVLKGGNRTLAGTIRSAWLHGAPASGLNTDISLTMSRAPVRFESFPGFMFDDASRTYTSETRQIVEAKLDEQGATIFRYPIPRITEAPGRLTGRMSLRVFERSGNFSTSTGQFDYYPYTHYVGLKLPESDRMTGGLQQNREHELEIVTVDAEGRPAARQDLRITIFELGWRWWWQEPGDGSGLYVSTRNLEPMARMTVNTGRDGKATAKFTIGDIYGRILVRVEDPQGGHSASDMAYIAYSWQEGATDDGPARLALSTDKESYRSGERARITFPSAAGSRALVSLETGSQILRTFWVDTQQGETTVDIDTGREMSPNIYAHVMLLQPHGQMINDLPVRMYGVVPVLVEDPQTKLKPVLKMPAEVRPESRFTLNLREEEGRAMTYTVAVVDEGLLSLTNFRTPDPHGHFYAREALGVRTWDMFDLVAGPYTGSMSRILAIGGDREAADVSSEPEITRFRPVVRYLGPFHLAAGRDASHVIDIPNYIGSVRVMVVAGQNGAYGHASGNIPVRQPLMALATLPRVLGPGEQVQLPVTLFTGPATSGSATVDVSTTGNLTIEGESRRNVAMNSSDQKTTRFSLRVPAETGPAEVTTGAELGGERASDRIEIMVRNPNPPVTRVYQTLIQPGEAWEVTPVLPGITGTNRVTLELSAIVPIDLERRLGSLIHYPHGCLEQIVSAAFPQLYLSNFSEMSPAQTQQTEKNIRDAIERIRRFQTAGGSLAYWPGRQEINEWSNIYAFHFLVEAARKGYSVPDGLRRGLSREIRSKALGWRPGPERNDALMQAYRLYVAALDGSPEAGAMNRLREHENMPSAARWRLAAAYQLAGQPEAATAVASGGTRTVETYREWGYTFGSALRDQALILEALSLMDRRTDAADLVQTVSQRLASHDWLSTQETAFSLIAVARYLEGIPVSDRIEAEFRYGDENSNKRSDENSNGHSTGEWTVSSSLPLTGIPLDPVDGSALTVHNRGGGALYGRLIVSGNPLEGEAEPSSNALRLQVRYLNLNGEETDPANLRQGEDLVIETRVTNPGLRGRYSEMALTQILPSGWEIRNTRMDAVAFREVTSTPQYQDIRDDRVLTYFGLAPNETKIFRVMVNASYAGRYYLPSVSAYAMYDESVFARTGGKWVEVTGVE